jgi:predicted HTH domain antitoxin
MDSGKTEMLQYYDKRERVIGMGMSLLLSDDIIQASGLSERELLLEIVIMLFQQDKISLGKASELLEIHRMQFQKLLSEREICVHYDVAEFEEDLKTLQGVGW